MNSVIEMKPIFVRRYISQQITWYSPSNPNYSGYVNIELDGYTPIAVSYQMMGTLSSFAHVSSCRILDKTRLYIEARMHNTNPSSTTQNTIAFDVVYVQDKFVAS